MSYKALKGVKNTLRAHHSKDPTLLRRVGNEMATLEDTYPWKCGYCSRLNKKTHTTCPKCQSHWSQGTRHNTEPRGKEIAYRTDGWETWGAWDQSAQTWEGDSWSWQASPSTPRQRTQSPRARKGKMKGKEGKGKDSKGKGGADGVNSSPFAPLAPSLTPWPMTETSGASLFGIPSTSTAAMPAGTNTQDVLAMAAALKEAYPDEKARPDNVKLLIDKAEKETAKDVAKGLHAATKALSKAQKVLRENNEAKQHHKAQWAKHVGEAIQTWQNQLREFRKQQTAFQEVSEKAKHDIDQARSTIQELNTNAANTGLTGPLVPSAVEEDTTVDGDKEEERLKKDMQTVLQNCARSLGLDLGTLREVQEVPSEEEKEEEPSNKRPRSMEPFGGSATMQS